MSDDGPLSNFDRSMMWQVVAAWAQHYPADTGSRFLDGALRNFNAIDRNTVLQIAARSQDPMDLGSDVGWLVGPQVRNTVPASVPVATIQLDWENDEVSRCSVRVGVFSERQDSTVSAYGWRYELAEPGVKEPNQHQHAQVIIGWTIDSMCLIHPPNNCEPGCRGIEPSGDKAIDEERLAASLAKDQSHPAFPLPSKTMTGLLLSCLVSLYGVPMVRELLTNEHRLSRAHGAVAEDRFLLLG